MCYCFISKPWNLELGLWSLVFRGSGGGRPCCCGFGVALVVATDRYLVTAGCLVVVGDCGVGLAVAGLVVPGVVSFALGFVWIWDSGFLLPGFNNSI